MHLAVFVCLSACTATGEASPELPLFEVGEPARALLGRAPSVGPEAVVALYRYADALEDEDQRAVALGTAASRASLLPEDVSASYGAAFATPMRPEAFVVTERDWGATDPDFLLDGDHDQRCPLEALSCELSPECEDYLGESTWGYSLTHQALTLVFVYECDAGDPWQEARRRVASRLAHAHRADPAPSDLAFERVAMLAELGAEFRTNEETTAWWAMVSAVQNADGGFPWDGAGESHAHTTAVALWALSVSATRAR